MTLANYSNIKNQVAFLSERIPYTQFVQFTERTGFNIKVDFIPPAGEFGEVFILFL